LRNALLKELTDSTEFSIAKKLLAAACSSNIKQIKKQFNKISS
jgi:hypothetical protein